MTTLIDTSSWIEALRKNGNPVTRLEIQQLLLSGGAGWCDLVRLELWNGVRGETEKLHLTEIEKAVTNLPIDSGVWELSMGLARQARLLKS